MREKMKSRALAALLSSLISQVLLLLLLLFPSSNSFPILNSVTTEEFLFPLLHHFLSTAEIATSLTFLSLPRKRKRTRFGGDGPPDDDDDKGIRLAQVGRIDSVIPKNPDSFQQFFMMNSSTFEWLCGLLEPLLECRDPVDSPLNLPAETRLGIGLFRLATGSDYPEISRRFRVSEPISKFCVKQLCRVLCTNYRFWVGFPCPNELYSASIQFEELTGMPNCCGIIDCARFKIITNEGSGSISKDPPSEDTIAAQIVVDGSSKILSITAGFHGNKSEFMILKSSTLYKDIEKGLLLNSQTLSINGVDVPQYFVGGGEYPLLPWLLIPFVDPLKGSCEEDFNNVLNVMRLPVLKTIASLRNWGVLNRPINDEFKAAVACIGACSILHNMLLTREDFSAFCDEVSGSASQNLGLYCRLEENLKEKASAIRSALATKARDFS